MSLLILNTAVFIHSHRLADGTIITHAHPFQKSKESNQPYKTHHHNNTDLFRLREISTYLFSIPTVFLPTPVRFDSCIYHFIATPAHIKSIYCPDLVYRGPPFIS